MDYVNFRPKVGENLIRILPLEYKELSHGLDDFFLYMNEPFAYPMLQHFNKNGHAINCLESWKEDCPIEQELSKKQYGNMYQSVQSYYMNVVVDNRLCVWRASRRIYLIFERYSEMPEYKGFISPEDGMDCHLFRKGQGISTMYDIILAKERTPLEQNYTLYDFEEIFQPPTQKEIDNFIQTMEIR